MKCKVVGAFCAAVLAGVVFPLATAAAAPPPGADWPQLLGSNRDGTAPDTNLLRQWPPEGPKVLWRVPIEQGWSCPSVSGGDVFLTSAKGINGNGADEIVQCLDAGSGKEKWHYSYKAVRYSRAGHFWGGPRSTPAVTDQYVYTIGVVGDALCLDRKSGNVVWKTSLVDDVYPEALKGEQKGFNQSPEIVDGVLGILVKQGSVRKGDGGIEESTVVGLDAATGKVKWTFKEDVGPKTWSSDHQSAAVADFGGQKCFVWTVNRSMRAFRPSDGKILWQFESLPPGCRGTDIAALLIHGNDIVEMPNEFCGPTLVEVDRANPPFAARKVWSLNHNQFPTLCPYQNLIPFGDYLYGFDGQYNPNKTEDAELALVCVELKTGKVMWSQGGFKLGVSLIEADGLLFARSYQTLTLVEATPEGYRVKGQLEKLHAVPNKGVTEEGLGEWVMPVLSRGRLYLRMPRELICFNVSREGNP